MRILWLSAHLPYPASSGGRLRELELLRRLATHAEVQVVAVSKTPQRDEQHLAAFRRLVDAELHPAEPDDRASCALVGRHRSRSAGAAVRAALRADVVDLVHVEGFYLAQHVPEPCPVPLVVADQNIEFQLWEQRSQCGQGLGPVAQRALDEAARCRDDEMAAWRRADCCITVTEDDAEVVRRHAPGHDVVVVPDGADHLTTTRTVTNGDRRPGGIVYVGNYGYAPNVDAACFLLDEILPRIRQRLPDVPLTLVGGEPPPALVAAARKDPLVRVTGWVDDLTAFLESADVVLCPLRVGGGVKVKVLEALAAGAALITTPIGAQGLPRNTSAPMVVDADAEALATATVRVLCDPVLASILRAGARSVAQVLPTWDDVAHDLLAVYEDLLASAQIKDTA